tara:strand:+ start:303 stop:485 length:183 start_codon:yes stop_codon:yes gene_type:complete
VVAETLQTQTEILEQQTQAAVAVAALTLELEAAADQASLSFVTNSKQHRRIENGTLCKSK